MMGIWKESYSYNFKSTDEIVAFFSGVEQAIRMYADQQRAVIGPFNLDIDKEIDKVRQDYVELLTRFGGIRNGGQPGA